MTYEHILQSFWGGETVTKISLIKLVNIILENLNCGCNGAFLYRAEKLTVFFSPKI